MALFRCSSGGGGGGSTAKSGTFTLTTAGQSSGSIPTGLTTISRLVVMGRLSGSAYECGVTYDKDGARGSNLYFAYSTASGGDQLGWKTIGQEMSDFAPILYSISGGDFVVKGASRADVRAAGTYFWYAE